MSGKPSDSVSNTWNQVLRERVSNTQEGPKDTVSNTLMQIGLGENVYNMQELPTDSMSNTLEEPKDYVSKTKMGSKKSVSNTPDQVTMDSVSNTT